MTAVTSQAAAMDGRAACRYCVMMVRSVGVAMDTVNMGAVLTRSGSGHACGG